jgi:hypothetical protein
LVAVNDGKLYGPRHAGRRGFAQQQRAAGRIVPECFAGPRFKAIDDDVGTRQRFRHPFSGGDIRAEVRGAVVILPRTRARRVTSQHGDGVPQSKR